MQYVWVLVFYMAGGSYNGGPAVIDNIATKEECVRIQQIVLTAKRIDDARCIEVRKVRP
jgi:hypothetical protein